MQRRRQRNHNRTILHPLRGIPGRTSPEGGIDHSRDDLVERVIEHGGIAGPLVVEDSWIFTGMSMRIHEVLGKVTGEAQEEIEVERVRTCDQEECTALYANLVSIAIPPPSTLNTTARSVNSITSDLHLQDT